jgi:hypothetical protein
VNQTNKQKKSLITEERKMFDANQMPQMQPMGGYAYSGFQGQPQATQKFNNVLTADQIKRLQQNTEQFQIGLTEEEMLRAVCNHRSADGMTDSLVFDKMTGIARCTICGYEFRPADASENIENIKDAVDRVIDYIQTVKIMYFDFPASAAQEYFPIIPLLSKLPKLFEFAAKNMSKHEAYGWAYNNYNMGAVQMLNNLNSMFGGMNGMGYQQPMMQQPQAPQMGYQQPNPFNMQQPMAAAPAPSVAPSFGPSAYVPPVYGGYTPQPNTAPVAPTADPVVSNDATVTKEVTV